MSLISGSVAVTRSTLSSSDSKASRVSAGLTALVTPPARRDGARDVLTEYERKRDYDINTKLPFRFLETAAVRLEPLIPMKHLEGLLSLPEESWTTLGDLGPYDRNTALEDIEAYRQDPDSLLLAVIDKQREAAGLECFAGIYGLAEFDGETMNIVFDVINILPRYHRTHVNTHAMSLILHFLFDEVQVVRVQYDAVTFNTSSIKAALRFGFKEEGVCRNLNGLVPTKKRRDGEKHRLSQDLWLSGMTSEQWAEEAKARIEWMCNRDPVDTTAL